MKLQEEIKMRKKMKSMVVTVLSLALTGAVLTGCGESSQSRQEIQQDIPGSGTEETQQETSAEVAGEETAEVETAEQPAQASEGYEDNFAVDREAAKEFAGKVKDAAAKKDLDALAGLTAFPVYVGLPDVGVVETKEDFLELGADTVFTDELLESIEKADINNMQPSMAGFSVSDGGTANINFGVTDGVLAINGINY
ncbi:MAG: hypothetical protein HFI98_14415 [Lachnospiraceae bacterium]|nr:hypothetical protein [Lachnospiraceae bacterium]